MRRMTEEDENTMTLKFRLAMDDELEKHRGQITLQWPEFEVEALLQGALTHIEKAQRARAKKDTREAMKQMAHAGNYLAMAYDNQGSLQENRS